MSVNKRFVVLSRRAGWKCSGKRQVLSEEVKMDFGAVRAGVGHRHRIRTLTFPFRLQSLPSHPSDYSPRRHHILEAAMPSTTAETLSLVNRSVSVAPLVLLSATDHYARSAKGTRKRVVGVLLGQNDGKNVRVSNSFAGTLPPLVLAS